jgi:hypothetical protein
LEINEALDGGLLVSTPPLLPLGSGLFLLGHELLEGGSLVAWRPVLLDNT